MFRCKYGKCVSWHPGFSNHNAADPTTSVEAANRAANKSRKNTIGEEELAIESTDDRNSMFLMIEAIGDGLFNKVAQ